jgi:hypothetical protein
VRKISAICFIIFVLPCGAVENATPNAETQALLTEFAKSVAKLDHIPADKAVEKAKDEIAILSKKISDEQLAGVESFALAKGNEQSAWTLGLMLAERKKFDAAAHVFVEQLIPRKGNRKYSFWKFWEYYFGERPENEYREVNRQIFFALVRQFETGKAEYKEVVSELFDQGEAGAKMSAEEFKKAIGFEKIEARKP